MTTATLTDAATVTLAFPLAAAEGLRHAITLAIHERPTSERDMLASIYGALVNPQPAPVRAARATVDVLAVMDSCTDELEKQPGCYYTDAAKLQEARAAIAELIEAANRAHMALIGYLPAHRNAVTDEAIAKVSAAIARVGSAGGAL